MATTNYNLPTITGNMTADVVRDMNALAVATDSALKDAVDGIDLTNIEQSIESVDGRLTTHLDESLVKTVGGTETALIIPIANLVDGYPITFIASADNSGSATTINGKPLYFNYVTSKKVTDNDNFITRVHKCIITECTNMLEETGLLEILSYPSIKYDVDSGLLYDYEYIYYGMSCTLVEIN